MVSIQGKAREIAAAQSGRFWSASPLGSVRAMGHPSRQDSLRPGLDSGRHRHLRSDAAARPRPPARGPGRRGTAAGRDRCLAAVITVMAHTDMPAYPAVLAGAHERGQMTHDWHIHSQPHQKEGSSAATTDNYASAADPAAVAERA